jgi:hypothetical protein
VDQICTPLIDIDLLDRLLANKVINQEDYAEQAFHLLGISPDKISVVPVKQPAEINTEKLALDTQRLKLDQEIARERNKIEMKKAMQPQLVAPSAHGDGDGDDKGNNNNNNNNNQNPAAKKRARVNK